jgi:FAD/FMN-containing dehydrogenase
LTEALWSNGASMINQGDVNPQSLAGAISTGTHGTGATLGSISTAARAFRLMLADGTVVTCSATERPAVFEAQRLSLGPLGVATRIEIDVIWLSPFNKGPGASISMHQYAKIPWGPIFAEAEQIFRAYDGRPHWAKCHTLSIADVHALYPQAAQFCAVRDMLDPSAKFANSHLSTLFDVQLGAMAARWRAISNFTGT